MIVWQKYVQKTIYKIQLTSPVAPNKNKWGGGLVKLALNGWDSSDNDEFLLSWN